MLIDLLTYKHLINIPTDLILCLIYLYTYVFFCGSTGSKVIVDHKQVKLIINY